MTAIFEAIQKQRQEARGSKDRAVEASILTLVIGELETASKRVQGGIEPTDVVVIAAIEKLFNSNKQTIEMKGEADSAKLIQENAVLSAFIPEKMDESALLAHIQASGATDIKGVMAYLQQFNGLYDKKLASKLAQAFVAK